MKRCADFSGGWIANDEDVLVPTDVHARGHDGQRAVREVQIGVIRRVGFHWVVYGFFWLSHRFKHRFKVLVLVLRDGFLFRGAAPEGEDHASPCTSAVLNMWRNSAERKA